MGDTSEAVAGGNGWNRDAVRIEIPPLAISVTPMTAQEVASIVTQTHGKRLLLNHNLHSAYLHETDGDFSRLYKAADWVIVDGAPILWLASRYSRARWSAEYRISSTDWVAALPSAPLPRRLFLFGANATSNENAVARLKQELGDWIISGIDGYVDEEIAVRRICEFRPDLVLVGLGMPRQEHFLLRNLSLLPDATYATVGGAIDYLAGTTRLAPRWMGRVGVEWLWRLLNEPRRLAHRYIVEPVLLLRRVRTRNARSARRSGRTM